MTLAQQDGPALPQQPATLWDAFQSVIRESPDRTAIRCCSQSVDDLSWLSPAPNSPSTVEQPFEWTYSQLGRAAKTLAKRLDRSGIRQGSVLAVFCTGNTAEWAVLFWACLCLGATFAPLNARLVDRPEELRHVLETLQPSGIVSLDGHSVELLSTKFSEMIYVETVKFRLHNDPLRGGQSSRDGWQSLSELGHAAQEPQPHSGEIYSDRNHSHVALILLTSGTTAMPKAAAHTDANLLSESALYSYARGLDIDSTVMMVGPAFHILGVWSMLTAWRAGATVLVPAAGFDAAASVSALNDYAVTHLPCSPSVIDTLVAHPAFSSSGYDNLKALAIGSDRVSDSLLKKCESFGKAKIINGWGMTECIGILSFDFSESIPWRDDKLSIGHIMPGSSIKVCSFDTINVTTRGEIGELYVAGSSVIDGYFSRGRVHRGEQFHEADGKVWFATGDAVVMDDSGAVYVTGRRKDLIIRGGENIHPGLIERCIGALETVNAAHAFGVDDESFGQAIAAVLQVSGPVEDSAKLKSDVQHAVISQLGPAFRLAHVHTLAELGLSNFPMTATGKIRKTELATLVQEMVENSTPSGPSGDDSTLTTILGIWKGLCGPGSFEILPETNVTQVVDSLVILRFCSQVEKQLGKQFSPADVLNNSTPAVQARALNDRSAAKSDQSRAALIDPTIMASANPSWLKYDERATIAATLDSLGLDKADVEAVYTPHDYMSLILGGAATPSSNTLRWTFRPKADVSMESLRYCLYQCLRDHANMRSIVVPLQTDTITPSHVHLAIKPTEQWLGMIVQEQDSIQTQQDAQKLLRSRDRPFCWPNGPASRVEVIPVHGSQRPVLLFSATHAVFDALSLMTFFEDLDASLAGEYVNTQKIPYYVFAEMYRVNQGNALSRASDDYYVKFMQSIDVDLGKYAWPTPRGTSPLYTTGDDQGWKEMDNSEPLNPQHQRVSLDELAGTPRGAPVVQHGHFPNLHDMKVKHGIEAHTLAKAAVAIFNTEQTGMDRAFFANMEAGRTWPYVDQWTAQHLPNIMNMAGPTLGASLDFLRISPTETLSDLLNRIAEKQKLDTLHCHASWDNVGRRLGQSRAEFRLDIARQWINWDATAQSRAQKDAKALERLSRAGWLDVGAFWNFGQPRTGEIEGFMLYDDVHLSRVDAQKALDRVFEILSWLADPSHLQSPLKAMKVSV